MGGLFGMWKAYRCGFEVLVEISTQSAPEVVTHFGFIFLTLCLPFSEPEPSRTRPLVNTEEKWAEPRRWRQRRLWVSWDEEARVWPVLEYSLQPPSLHTHPFTPAKPHCTSKCISPPLCAVVLKTQSRAKGKLFEAWDQLYWIDCIERNEDNISFREKQYKMQCFHD